MKVAPVALLIPLLLGASATRRSPAVDDTYDVVVAAMQCHQDNTAAMPGEAKMDCAYHVGRSLWFEVAGVGAGDAAITVMRADIDGDYYVSVGSGQLHDCAIVKPGATTKDKFVNGSWNLAFVSPRNGKVYRTWQECAAAK